MIYFIHKHLRFLIIAFVIMGVLMSLVLVTCFVLCLKEAPDLLLPILIVSLIASFVRYTCTDDYN
jgi:hypothetical protein